MLPRLAIFSTIALFTSAASSAVGEDMNKLAAGILQVSKHYESVYQEMRKVTGEINARVDGLAGSWQFLQKPYDPQELARLDAQVKRYEQQLQRARDANDHEEQRRLENLILFWQPSVDAAGITDPKQRRARAEQIKQELRPLQAEQTRLEAPFRKQQQEIAKASADVQARFTQAIGVHILDPGGAYPDVARKEVTGRPVGQLYCTWYDSDGQRVAVLSMGIRDKPTIPANGKWLEDKHFLINNSDRHLAFYAGYFQVYFHVHKEQWYDRERVKGMVKHFIDLDGLARMDPSATAPVRPGDE